MLDSSKHLLWIVFLGIPTACLTADIAFVNRADIKAYIGPSTLHARCFLILKSNALIRTERTSGVEHALHIPSYASIRARVVPVLELEMADICNALVEAADACEELGGRSLHKLLFLIHASLV
ncbi:hypothetical protein MLD38_039413 [Melastoma candidum]|uniref:Uncharacterized protein n=1 Tax=Melastoma candidum TaxID=119954 RepID=A0ACB9L3E4_9MYRT|nr:hypothetical protein MLD38_039413 [Melastoma candidum]